MIDFFSTLMPIPCELSSSDGHLSFMRHLTFSIQGGSARQVADFSQLATFVFGEWLAVDGLHIDVSLDPSHAPGELSNIAEPLRLEAYELIVDNEKMTLTAAHFSGLQRGIQTIKQLLENAEDTGMPIPTCRIVDWPRLAHRGIHFDFAREMEYRHEYIKTVIAKLAYFKMNTFHLYLEGIFAFPSAAEITPPGAMTPDHVKDLREYAQIFGITLVPQISTLGHMDNLLNGPYAELRENAESASNLCPTHPNTRPFLSGMIKDIAEAFEPSYIHLGYDESHSGYCDRCKQHGTPDVLLAEHLNWMNSEVKKYGARAMIYGDKFLSPCEFPESDATNGGWPEQAHAALARISRDIIITDWHYVAPQGRTFGYLVEQGFEVHLASATNIFWHDSIPFHRGHHWIVETIDNAVSQGVSGAFNCNWEFYRGAFLENFWFFEALAAERQWSNCPHNFITFSPRFSKRFWGLDCDYYADIAGLMETTTTNRRELFLDSSVFADSGPMITRMNHIGIADYLDRQLAEFRNAARRNGDSLRMLDMLTLIIRYLGVRMLQIAIARNAFELGERERGIAAFQQIKAVAQQVAEKLEEGYQRYGAAVKDRVRIQQHINEIDNAIDQYTPSEHFVFRNYDISALQPQHSIISDVELPPSEVKFTYLMNVHLVELADVRATHCHNAGIIYLRSSVEFLHAFAGRLLYGSDGPVKIWVNGEVVDCRPDATNPCTADEYACQVHWREGNNEVIFALDTNQGKAWGLCARTSSAR